MTSEEELHSDTMTSRAESEYVYPDPPPSPPGYAFPEAYCGWLADGRAVLVLVMSSEAASAITVGPLPSVPGFSGMTLLADRRGTGFTDGYRDSGPLESIFPALQDAYTRRMALRYPSERKETGKGDQ